MTTSRTECNIAHCFCIFCCCFILPILIILTIIFNLEGKIPLKAEIPTIEIETITVSNFTLSNPISAHWNIDMTMHSTGPSLEFLDSTISIFHESKEEALWMMSLRKFDMRPKNSTFHFALDFWGSSADVDNATVRAIGEKITNNHGAVKFNVEIKADKLRTTRLKYPIRKLWFKLKVKKLVFSCDVMLLFGSLDKTHADMLKTDSQACILVTYDP